MKSLTLIVASWTGLALAYVTSAADVPRIGFTDSCPFDANGNRIEKQWRHADTCIRFLEVRCNDAAVDTADAQLLFDEQNIYVSLIGRFTCGHERGRLDLSIWHSNHFEIRLRPGGQGTDCLQVNVDEYGRLAVARNENEVVTSDVRAWTERGSGYWRAAVVIPFSALGTLAPSEDTTYKVGLFRQNINVPEGVLFNGSRLSASSYTPNCYNYSVGDDWADMLLTRGPFLPRRVPGPALGQRVNLMPNPDFKVASCGWSMYSGARRQETMQMSGVWTCHVSGKGYQFLQGSAIGVFPNTRYTLVVRARSFGTGSALRIVPMVRTRNGKVSESPYVVNLLPLGSEFHDYYLPFTTSADTPLSFVFYKVDSGAADTGVDVAGVRLYEGEISAFEIRHLTRPGRMTPERETAIPMTPNAYGRFPRPIHILALCSGKPAMREVLEVTAGLSASVDLLVTTGTDQDVYETDSDSAAVTKALENSSYDVYLVPANGAERIGPKLAEKIVKNIEGGAGVYLEQNRILGHLKRLEKNGACGHGRVVRRALAGGRMGYLPQQSIEELGMSLFSFGQFAFPEVAEGIARAAFGEPTIPSNARISRSKCVYAGVQHIAVKTLDEEGRTLTWRHERIPIAGGRLGAFSDDGTNSCVHLLNVNRDDFFRWTLLDFSGRELAVSTVPAQPEVVFVVPRTKLYTNYGGIRLELLRDGKVRDCRGEALFLPENDRARLMDDFTPSMWPIGDDAPVESLPALHRRLEEIGLRASLIPPGGTESYALVLRTGLGVGGTWIGDSDRFCVPPQKSNVRAQQFNTAESRQKIFARAKRISAATSKYGLLHHSICDEPGLTRTWTADEVDAHPDNLAVYRERMAAKYGSIGIYNRRHGTAYASFAELDQALLAETRASGNPAEFIEWRNFNVDRWVEAIGIIAKAAKEQDAATPLSLCNTFGQSALSGNDYWKLLTKTGVGFSHEYTAMVYFGRSAALNFDEFFRSFRPDLRLWGWTGYFYTSERARFMPWWFAAHRYGGFSWYAAAIWGYNNLVDLPTYAYTTEGRELKRSLDDSRLLTGLGKVLTCWRWAPREVALYYSHDSMLLSTWLGKEVKNMEVLGSGPLHDYFYSRQGAQYLVEDLLYQHDFVSSEQIVGGRLSSCKVLFMPRILAMGDAEVAAVKAFVMRGGKVVCDVLPGAYDELGMRRSKNPFDGFPGIVTLERNFDDGDVGQRRLILQMLRSSGAMPAMISDSVIEHAGREAMHYVSADADVYVVLRMLGRSSDREEDDLHFVKAGHVYDVRRQSYLGHSDAVTTSVGYADAAVFAVLPEKIESLIVEGLPSTLHRGADLDVRMGVVVAAIEECARMPEYVLHVEMIPPNGKVPFHFTRNLMTTSGRCRFAFAIAQNDPIGIWRLRVSEPLTGVSAEREFVVE